MSKIHFLIEKIKENPKSLTKEIRFPIKCKTLKSNSMLPVSLGQEKPAFRDKSTNLWTPYLRQRRQEYTMEKRQPL